MTEGISTTPFIIPPAPYWARARAIGLFDEYVPVGGIRGINFVGTHQVATKVGDVGNVFVDDQQDLDIIAGYSSFYFNLNYGHDCPADGTSPRSNNAVELIVNEISGSDFHFVGLDKIYIDCAEVSLYRLDYTALLTSDQLDLCNPPCCAYCWLPYGFPNDSTGVPSKPYILFSAKYKSDGSNAPNAIIEHSALNFPIGCCATTSPCLGSSRLRTGFFLFYASNNIYIDFWGSHNNYAGDFSFSITANLFLQRLKLTPS